MNTIHIVVCDHSKRRAIAIVYDETKHHAPVILTKRGKEDALKVVTLAEGYGITIIRDDALSTALYAQCTSNRVIPETLFAPIAEILATVIKQEGDKKIKNLKLYEDIMTLKPHLHQRLRTINTELANIEKKIIKTTTRLDNALLNELDSDIDEIIDYELEVSIDCYGVDGIDFPLCSLHEYLKGFSKKSVNNERFGMDDGENHNEFFYRQEHPMVGEYHCWLFHCLYDHNYLTWEEIAAIQNFWVDIKPRYQYRFDAPDTLFAPPARHLIYSNNYQSMFHDVVRDVMSDFAQNDAQHFTLLRKISRLLWGDTARMRIDPLIDEELNIYHSTEYLKSLREDRGVIEKIIGCTIPSSITMAMLNDYLIDPYRSMCAGTIQSAHLALQIGWVINLTGGFNRFFDDYAVAAEHLLKTNPSLKILDIDLDAVVSLDIKEPLSHSTNFYTFDIFDDLAQLQYQNHINDTVYLSILREYLPASIDSIRPDIIFYRASKNGSNDTSKSTSLTPDGMKERDLFIFSEAKQRSIPIMMNIGNGYDQENDHQLIERIEEIIEMMGNSNI